MLLFIVSMFTVLVTEVSHPPHMITTDDGQGAQRRGTTRQTRFLLICLMDYQPHCRFSLVIFPLFGVIFQQSLDTDLLIYLSSMILLALDYGIGWLTVRPSILKNPEHEFSRNRQLVASFLFLTCPAFGFLSENRLGTQLGVRKLLLSP